MNNKAELVAQLRRMCDLIYERDQADYKREEINGKINLLHQESQTGVKYQTWHPTDYAQKHKQATDKKLHSQKVRRRTPCIIAMPICGVWGFACLAAGISEADGTLRFFGIVLLLLAITALTLLIVVQKNGEKWSDQQIAELQQAEKIDNENKVLNEMKRSMLEKELCEKNNARIAELTKQREEYDKVFGKASLELMGYSILSPRDHNWKTANGLLEILESNRAETLQEAFCIFDEQKHREQMLKATWEQQRMQEKMLEQIAENEKHRQEEAEQLRQDQLRRDRAEEEHRREMERLQWKQIDELERKRKADDDYRRSGYIEGNW